MCPHFFILIGHPNPFVNTFCNKYGSTWYIHVKYLFYTKYFPVNIPSIPSNIILRFSLGLKKHLSCLCMYKNQHCFTFISVTQKQITVWTFQTNTSQLIDTFDISLFLWVNILEEQRLYFDRLFYRHRFLNYLFLASMWLYLSLRL